ncbi:MAG TPA: SDR family NAD(P)-dependent oxidoreductase, partial [Pseudomonadales bacterium]|nr:SDR family NAD(P)-dependent oxidoreductase [Pseudomonadales bacterium]
MDLKDKVVVVTGSGRGLGRAMAVEFAKAGAKIAVVDLDPAAVEETVAKCKEVGSDAKAYLINVAKEDQVIKLFDDVVADFGRLDGLINNAGILRDAMLVKFDKEGNLEKKMTLEQWQAVIDVNLTGVFL